MMPLYIAVVCALICFVLYALDRRLRGESIDVLTATKLVLVGGLLGGGIAYTVSPADVAQVVETVKEVVEAPKSEEMFVGVPAF